MIETTLSRRLFIRQAARFAGLGFATILGSAFLPTNAQATSAEFARLSFDLTQPGHHEAIVTLPDGTDTVFGIEIPSKMERDGYSESLGNGYGNFKTYWYTGLINIRFWIRVDNYAISYCYDPWAGAASSPVYSIVIDWTDLDWGSSWCRMATRYHDSGFGIYETKFIEGRIQGSTITYSFWIG